MNGKNIIILLFLIFGIYAIINPDGISIENTQKSYNVSDLIRGWGIYSITIGSILLFPDNIKFILEACFVCSIIWHLLMIENQGITPHHIHSIIINLIALIIVFVSF
jgi:hypothetical protein